MPAFIIEYERRKAYTFVNADDLVRAHEIGWEMLKTIPYATGEYSVRSPTQTELATVSTTFLIQIDEKGNFLPC